MVSLLRAEAAAGAADVNRLAFYLDAFEAASGIPHGTTRIITVATETARAVIKLMDFENMSPRLWGMMWGAEDLAASLGALPPGSREAAVLSLLERHGDDPIVMDAALSGVRGRELAILERLQK